MPGTDRLVSFCVDERLEDELDAFADDVDAAASADRVEQFGEIRLFKGHWVSPSECSSLFTPKITR
jgi:hypothetical protein